MKRTSEMKSRATAAAEGRKRQILAQRMTASPSAESLLKGPFEDSVAALLILPQVVSAQSEMAAKVQAVRAFLESWQAEVHGRWEEVAAVLAVRNGWNFTVGREHTLLMRIAIGVPDKSRWISKRRAIKLKTESLAMRWRRKIGQAAKVGSTSLKDGLYDWETEAVLG